MAKNIKKAKMLVGLLLLACLICFSIVNYQPFSTIAQEVRIANREVPLKLDVFVASETGALAVSTLIEGKKDAILVDGLYFLADGKQLADWVARSGKNLKAIWITHAHPDHYFAVTQVLERFPNTPVYSIPEVVEDIRRKNDGYVKEFKAMFGDRVTDKPIVPQVFTQDHLELEGQRIEIIKAPQGDTHHTTILHIPSIKSAIVADIVYSGVHGYFLETNVADRQKWIETINQLKALNLREVIPGHKIATLDNSPSSLDAMQQYIETFNRIVKEEPTAEAAYQAIEKAYPNHKLAGFILKLSTDAVYQNGNGWR
ncbi:hypothetical protein BCD67_23835 [Oscillatoriales cyanobacterium USR001]|nr:hypothetical protein BCD67_23835 [Oscillatoriales cyanobacterium USR001]